MKKSDRISNLIAILIFAPMVLVVVIAMGFMKFFLIFGGMFIGGFLFYLFIAPLFQKFDSYYERNKQKKYRFAVVFIFLVLGVLSGLAFLVLRTKGLFPDSANDFVYSLLVFGSVGFMVGLILSRFIKLKEKRYFL
jgi:hypothetical protein